MFGRTIPELEVRREPSEGEPRCGDSDFLGESCDPGLADSWDGSPRSPSDGKAVSSSSSGTGGPAVGVLPSLNALAISAAFHFAYLAF